MPPSSTGRTSRKPRRASRLAATEARTPELQTVATGRSRVEPREIGIGEVAIGDAERARHRHVLLVGLAHVEHLQVRRRRARSRASPSNVSISAPAGRPLSISEKRAKPTAASRRTASAPSRGVPASTVTSRSRSSTKPARFAKPGDRHGDRDGADDVAGRDIGGGPDVEQLRSGGQRR